MNKKTIIIGAVAVVAVAIAVVVATQWARLKTVASVAQNATMNEEQVTAKSSENEQIVQELEHDFRIPTIELTPEMEAAIADGSMSLEEAASQFLTTPDSAAVSEPAAESDAAPATDTATSPEPVADTGTTTAPDTGTTTAPDTGTTTAPEPPVSAVTSEPEPEPPVSAAIPEPTPEPPAPVSIPEPTPVAIPEPEPVATPEPEPTAQLSGVTEAPQEDTEAPEQNTVAPEPEAPQQNTAAPEPEAPQQSAADKAQAEQEARVQNLFAQLYVLRASFNTQLDNLIGECIQEFLALDPAEQTRAAKIRIVYARMDDVTAMEANCDAQVESIAAQLDEIDPALGTKARQYYKNEKDLKKASLIETYGK